MSMLFKRIKDWAVSITSFRTGDVIPVDGPSGTAKMPYSDLAKEVIKNSANNSAATEADLVAGSTLPIMTANGPKSLPGNTITPKTYAQNVAHSIAPEFDPTRTSENPYKAGESVTYTDGKVYTFKAPHYGPWSAGDVVDFDIHNVDDKINYSLLDGGLLEYEGTTDGHGINSETGGVYASVNLSASDYILCFGATSIKFLDYVGTVSTLTGFAFYDANKQYISGGYRSVGDSEGVIERVVSVPSGAYFFRSTYWSSTKRDSLGVDPFYAKVDYEGLAGKESVEELKISIGTENVVEVKKINALDTDITYDNVVNCITGVIGSSAMFDVCEFSLPELAQFVKIPIFCRTQTDKLSGFAFYDKDGTFIIGDGTNKYYAEANIYAVVEIPANAKTIAVSVSKALTLSSVNFVCYRAGGTKNKTTIIYGNNDCCNGYFAYTANGSISNAWSDNFGMFEKIPCKGAYKLIAKIPVYTTSPSNGIVFYDESENYIVARNRKADDNGSEVVDIMVPTNAAFVSVLAWNYDKQESNGGAPYLELSYIGDVNLQKRKKRSGQIHFSVIVDQSVTDWWDDEAMNSPSLEKSTCVLTLPDDYSENGTPSKLMVWFHGNSRNVSLAQWGLNDADYLAQKERFRAAGYAVLDCNGPCDNGGGAVSFAGCPQGVMAFLKAIRFAVEKYNLDAVPYLVGASAGGLPASALATIIPTKCLCFLSPNLSHKTWWDVNVRTAFTRFFGFDDADVWEQDKAVGWDMKSRINSGSIPAIYPRVMLFVGDAEMEGVFWQDMRDCMSAIRAGGGYAGLHICENANHGITNGQFPEVDQQVINWLDRF